MNNGSNQPASNQDPNQDPLHYAPRWARDTQQLQGPSATLRASRVEAEFEPDNAFPSSRVKSTPIRPPPPLSEPARRPFAVAFVTLTSILALVAIIAGVVVVTLYLREPFDVTGTVARTLVRARTTGSVAGESNPATPPARQVAAIEPPSPVQSEQRASVAPATATVVAPLRSTGF